MTSADSVDLLENWLPGMLRLGLQGIIFHHGLSDAFVRSQELGQVRFVQVEPSQTLSTNDYRFFVYYEWLAQHPEVRSLFCTDLFDVLVKNNPHELVTTDFQLWVGRERDWKIDHNTVAGRWMMDKFRQCYREIPGQVLGKPILNAGIFGGMREHVLQFLREMTVEIQRLSPGPNLNGNMAALNLVLYRNIGERNIWAQGAPLHSVFKRYDRSADVCFVHK